MVMEQENQVTPKLHQEQGTRQEAAGNRKHPSHASHSHMLGCHRAQRSKGQGSASCCLGILVAAGGREILVLHSRLCEAEQVLSFGVQFHL